MVKLTYLLVGKALNVLLLCKSKFKSSELNCQRRLVDKLMLIGNLFGFSVVLVSVWQCNFRKP